MPTRPMLDPSHITSAAQESIEKFHPDIVREVQDAVAANPVVVVGMRLNSSCTRACRLFEAQNIAFKYLEYGGYFSEWRRRLALKMWTGWPTFPMVFVAGTLVGGRSDTAKAFEDGTIRKLLPEGNGAR